MSIQVTLTFDSAQAVLDFFAGNPSAAVMSPKIAPAPAPAAGQATAKSVAAPKKTAAESAPAAPSVAAPAQASTAATESQETAPEGKPAAASSAPEAPAAQPASSVAPAVDYPTLQKAVFALANAKGRDAVIGLMKGTFGVGSAKELAPEQWAQALAAVNAALEA